MANSFNFIFAIDTSGSMRGSKIHAVNQKAESLVKKIRDFSSEKNVPCKLQVQQFNESMSVVMDFTPIAEVNWTEVSVQEGKASDISELLNNVSHYLISFDDSVSVLVLFTDGKITGHDYMRDLDYLLDEHDFKNAIKVVILLDNSHPSEFFIKFLDNPNAEIKNIYSDEILPFDILNERITVSSDNGLPANSNLDFFSQFKFDSAPESEEAASVKEEPQEEKTIQADLDGDDLY